MKREERGQMEEETEQLHQDGKEKGATGLVREWRGGAEKVWPPREQGEEHSFQQEERDKHHHSERDEGP